MERSARALLGVAVLAASVVSAAAAGKPAPPSWALHGSYSVAIKPGDFVGAVDNRYFPLKPGTAFHMRGTRDGAGQTDDMVVTAKAKYVLGVKCTVVEDTVSEHGKP